MSIPSPPNAPIKPQISAEEDLPFLDQQFETLSGPDASAISAEIRDADNEYQLTSRPLEVREQTHKHKVGDYKNIVGGIILAVCFLVIISFSIGDAVYHVKSDLFTGAFEFAKTIATAVIGYLFATNTKEK